MPYSRRKLLRHCAVGCLAGAVNGTFPLLTACKRNPPPKANPQQSAAAGGFSTGIRIFFIGSWLFAADPQDGSRVIAHTIDLPTPMHGFPYGQYQAGLDQKSDLPVTGLGNSHRVNVDTTSKIDVKTLFQNAADTQTFMWIPSVKLKADLSAVDRSLRRISVPIPNQVLTADFLQNSAITDPGRILHKPVTSQTGTPSAFVFDYSGATKLDTSFDTTHLTGSGTTDSDYHFRVVPHMNEICPDPKHAAAMFRNLVAQLLEVDSGKLPFLDVTNARDVIAGTNLSASSDELDIYKRPGNCPQPQPGIVNAVSLRTASCAGGGGAVGP